MTNINPAIFKAYDVRGIHPTELDEDVVYKIAQAYAALEKPKQVALGRDVRESGKSLWEAAKNGFIDAGVDVVDVGVISTDMLYFAVANYGYDGGLTLSASHNPKEYNGVKMVRSEARPISSDNGILEIRDWVLSDQKVASKQKGKVTAKDILDDYSDKVLSFLDAPLKRDYSIIANASYGMAGVALKRLIERGKLPISLTELHCDPDGNFTGGSPNPLDDISIEQMESAFKKSKKVDFGVVWDADADRCFFYDENGNFIRAYYTVAVLAKYFLQSHPGSNLITTESIHLAVKSVAKQHDANLILHKTGHSFIKATMRTEDCIFAGESSGHFYFRDFFYADNGLIPFVIILNLLEATGKSISELYGEFTSTFHISGEINVKTPNSKKVLDAIKQEHGQRGEVVEIDGVSIVYDDWRFNLRSSNTEPLIRLNVESANKELMQQKTEELLTFIEQNKS